MRVTWGVITWLVQGATTTTAVFDLTSYFDTRHCAAPGPHSPDVYFGLFHSTTHRWASLDPGIFSVESSPTSFISIVLVAHNEYEHLTRTIESIYHTTPLELLKEIIVIDDASNPPLRAFYDSTRHPPPLVRYVLNETRQGLIRSKSIGGDLALGSLIVFLDAHVKPDDGWLLPIMRHTAANYKRIVMPAVPRLEHREWTKLSGAVGSSMFMRWDMSFSWKADADDWAPLLSGGLLAIRQKWWEESGGYDKRMSLWGGENIDQSLRCWLCGGQVAGARDSVVSHYFRERFPYETDPMKPIENQARAARTWWDSWAPLFFEAQPAAKKLLEDESNFDGCDEIATRLPCTNFSSYLRRFEDTLRDGGVLPKEVFSIVAESGECIQVERGSQSEGRGLLLAKCLVPPQKKQLFMLRDQMASIQSLVSGCWDASSPMAQTDDDVMPLILYSCLHHNPNQVWNYDRTAKTISIGSYCLTTHKKRAVLRLCPPRALHGVDIPPSPKMRFTMKNVRWMLTDHHFAKAFPS